MKNIKYIIILIALIFPFVVNAATCQPEKVTIKNVTIKDISDNTEELEEPDINGREIGVNLKFQEVGDYITYKVLIRNDSDEDFEIDSNSININKDYMEYSVITNDKIIKANEEKTIELRVSYKTEVDSSKFVNGRYQDDQKMQLSLSNDSDEIVPQNPLTSNNRIIIIILVLIMIGVLIFSKQKLSSRNKMMLIMGIVLIPITAKAICKCQIDLNSHIEIEKVKEACVYIGSAGCSPVSYSQYDRRYYTYQEETTVEQFLKKVYQELEKESNSIYSREYDNRSDDLFSPDQLRAPVFVKKEVEECEQQAKLKLEENEDEGEFERSMRSCNSMVSNEPSNLTDPVKDKSLGCYNLTKNNLC